MGSSRKLKFNPSKFWHKDWIERKRKLYLSSVQKFVLVGSILGDGTLRMPKEGINANFKTEHGLRQKKYVLWKYNIFKNWVFTPPKISYRYRENTREKYEKSWWFRTVSHPEITEFWKIFYPSGKKIVPPDIDKFFTSLSLAVWVMDDGNLNKKNLNISTYSFNLDEIKLLQKLLEHKFGVRSNFYRDRDKGYRMYFSVNDTQKISCMIQSYVIPSMKYKLSITP